MRPEDPYAFTELLTATDMVSLERNRQLADMAERLRQTPALAQVLDQNQMTALPADFQAALTTFETRFGAGLGWAEDATRAREMLIRLLLEMARHGVRNERAATTKAEKVERFLACFDAPQRQRAADLLDLARASYRLRDDDNIHLGRIEQELARAAAQGRARLQARHGQIPEHLDPAEIARTLRDPGAEPQAAPATATSGPAAPAHARQLIGQPAGPGLATGRARVLSQGADLFGFKRGEVLVCDAVDPNMTFVVPLAAAVVERRGGMLIHGAIIAREYGLPCVTGVPDATSQIPNGAVVTVDGFLGIVTVVQR
jgi:pyruvate,water dikinase